MLLWNVWQRDWICQEITIGTRLERRRMTFDAEVIGKNIRKYRKNNKLTQSELAKKIGRTESSIRKYEKGIVKIPISLLEKIAEAFDVKLSNLCEKEPLIITNADRIRSMSDEELAEFINTDFGAFNCSDCEEPVNEYGSCTGNCKKLYLKWLSSEVEDDTRTSY